MDDDALTWTDLFEKRQRQEIEFCRVYARDFKHGTDGHNAKMIIAKMADLLDSHYLADKPKVRGD